MKGSLCLMLSALLLTTAGCSGHSNDAAKEHSQGAYLLSIHVKVIEVAEEEDDRFLTEVLESYTNKISQGDIVSVTAESAEMSSILRSYQENNNFRIYFPTVNDTSDGISVTCYDVVQYDPDGEVIRYLENGEVVQKLE